MKIFVKASPGSRENLIEKLDDTHFIIKTTTPPENNKANLHILKLLSKYLNLSKSKIILTKGEKSKDKIFKIFD